MELCAARAESGRRPHYARGSIVVTVDMLSTGVDIPDLEFIVFLRPVKSRILFEQMLGRGTRKGEQETYCRPARWQNSIESGSPPLRAAMLISLMMRVKTFPRLASRAAFLCLMVAHLECPDMIKPP